MRTPVTLLTLGVTLSLGASLGACEYYACGPGCDPCDPWSGDCEDEDPWGDDSGTEADADIDADTDTDTDTGAPEDPPPADIHFTLTPAEAEQGQVFIGSLAMSGADAPAYDAIAGLAFYGDVEALATDVRSFEVLVTLAVAPDGAGAVDLVAEFADGTATWEPGVLAIWPAGSGHAADGAGDPDPCE